jgi:hypothetical protein
MMIMTGRNNKVNYFYILNQKGTALHNMLHKMSHASKCECIRNICIVQLLLHVTNGRWSLR